jgi:cation transport protein ChaC
MCVWSILARGTPARPGLSLGLLPGGQCDGLVFRTAPPEAGAEGPLAAVWQREMWTDIYQPRWLDVRVGGKILPAIAFVANPESVQFAGELPEQEAAHYIATASGERGSCRDYLSQTLGKLRDLGMAEAALADLAEQAARINR